MRLLPFRRTRRQPEEKRSVLATAAFWRMVANLRHESQAGVVIDEATALRFAAVFACVRILAEDVSTIPLVLFQRGSDGSRRRAREHPLYELLHDRANRFQSAQHLRECVQFNLGLRGNALVYVQRDGAGRVAELWSIPWSYIRVRVEHGEVLYEVTEREKVGGIPEVLDREQVVHIPWISLDGVQGISPITYARHTIGLGVAAQSYGAKLFAQGSRPAGVIEVPTELSEEAFHRLKASWEGMHAGEEGWNRTAILEGGAKWHQVSIAPDDAQFLESRKFQVTEIARWWRIPPHMLQDLERATFSNVEQQSIDYVRYTLRPWLVRIEQSLNAQLLTAEERRAGFYFEHLVDGLMRGDTASRYEAYAKAIQAGFMAPNEARERENLDPVEGLEKPLQPLNMVPVGESDGDDGLGGPLIRRSGASEQRSSHRAARRALQLLPTVQEMAERIVRMEARELRKFGREWAGASDMTLVVKELQDLYRWLGEEIRRRADPTLRSVAGVAAEDAAEEVGKDAPPSLNAFVSSLIASFASRHVRTSVAEASEALNKRERGATVDIILNGLAEKWLKPTELSASRPERIARREVVQQSNAVRREVFRANGVTRLVWRTTGDPCPYCIGLDGRTVGIDEPFARKGEKIKGEGREPIKIGMNRFHPPIHPNCNCVIEPA